MAATVEQITDGFWFEICILIILTFLLIAVFRKYLVKRHRLTLLLFFIFVCFYIAIWASWSSKLIALYFPTLESVNPNLPFIESWFLDSLENFGITMIFAALAALITYFLKVQVFNEPISRVKIYIAEIFAVICILSDIILYQGIGYDTVINFLLVFVYMLIIYGTFMARALKLRKDVQEPQIKRAFGSLALMAFSFIVTFCCFLIDQIYGFLGIGAYSIFYYMAWIWAIIGMLGTYLGYITPKSHEQKDSK